MVALFDLTRLRILRELSLRGTMAAVGDALNMSSSAVSQHLQQLEHESRVKLLERDGRGVNLTPAAENLVAHVERLLIVIEEAQSDLDQMRGDLAGQLRITAFPSAAVSIMPSVLKQLAALHPKLLVTLQDMEPQEGLAALRSWNSDKALVDISTRIDDPSLQSRPLMTDHLYAILPPKHPLSRHRRIRLDQMAEEKWALNASGSVYSRTVLGLRRTAGFVPRVISHCRSVDITIALIQSGSVVSVLPGLVAKRHENEVCVRSLEPSFQRPISVAFRRGNEKNPAVSAALRELADVVQKKNLFPDAAP